MVSSSSLTSMESVRKGRMRFFGDSAVDAQGGSSAERESPPAMIGGEPLLLGNGPENVDERRWLRRGSRGPEVRDEAILARRPCRLL